MLKKWCSFLTKRSIERNIDENNVAVYRHKYIRQNDWDNLLSRRESYIFFKDLGFGSFGSVGKVKNSSTNEESAVKVDSKDHISKGKQNCASS